MNALKVELLVVLLSATSVLSDSGSFEHNFIHRNVPAMTEYTLNYISPLTTWSRVNNFQSLSSSLLSLRRWFQSRSHKCTESGVVLPSAATPLPHLFLPSHIIICWFQS